MGGRRASVTRLSLGTADYIHDNFVFPQLDHVGPGDPRCLRLSLLVALLQPATADREGRVCHSVLWLYVHCGWLVRHLDRHDRNALNILLCEDHLWFHQG